MFKTWRNNGYYLNYGGQVIENFASIVKVDSRKKIKILDIGCDDIRDLSLIDKNINNFKNDLYAISYKNIAHVKSKKVDIENNKIPFEDNFFEMTICNQVYEHLKNWLWAFHEQIRVTKKGGWAIVGFPNLGAFHCRLQLALGYHPSCLKLDDAHVRGFTKTGFNNVIKKIDGISIEKFSGSNMYGLPPSVAKTMGKLFPDYAVSIFFLIKKNKSSVNVIGLVKDKELETTYFTGN